MRGANLAETNALVAVLEQKSFSKAAKHLGLSPPRVSDMVRTLEERLGVRLVERTTRSVAPTAAGDRLLERLRPVLDDYREAFESINEFRNRPSGTLRLTAAEPAAAPCDCGAPSVPDGQRSTAAYARSTALGRTGKRSRALPQVPDAPSALGAASIRVLRQLGIRSALGKASDGLIVRTGVMRELSL